MSTNLESQHFQAGQQYQQAVPQQQYQQQGAPQHQFVQKQPGDQGGALQGGQFIRPTTQGQVGGTLGGYPGGTIRYVSSPNRFLGNAFTGAPASYYPSQRVGGFLSPSSQYRIINPSNLYLQGAQGQGQQQQQQQQQQGQQQGKEGSQQQIGGFAPGQVLPPQVRTISWNPTSYYPGTTVLGGGYLPAVGGYQFQQPQQQQQSNLGGGQIAEGGQQNSEQQTQSPGNQQQQLNQQLGGQLPQGYLPLGGFGYPISGYPLGFGALARPSGLILPGTGVSALSPLGVRPGLAPSFSPLRTAPLIAPVAGPIGLDQYGRVTNAGKGPGFDFTSIC